MQSSGATCWLVNTGWTGGKYGVGQRMPIKYTRAMLDAALNGDLDEVEYYKDDNFGLMVPLKCPQVPDQILKPESSWGDKGLYNKSAKEVARLFEQNFIQFKDFVDNNVLEIAIRADH